MSWEQRVLRKYLAGMPKASALTDERLTKRSFHFPTGRSLMTFETSTLEGKWDKSSLQGLALCHRRLNHCLECQHPISEHKFEFWLLHFWSNFRLMCLGKQQNMTQYLDPCNPCGRPRWTSRLCPDPALRLEILFLSPSPSLYHSVFWINK